MSRTSTAAATGFFQHHAVFQPFSALHDEQVVQSARRAAAKAREQGSVHVSFEPQLQRWDTNESRASSISSASQSSYGSSLFDAERRRGSANSSAASSIRAKSIYMHASKGSEETLADCARDEEEDNGLSLRRMPARR
ncbi:hypothetical protein CBOM_03239 [Ceraceosorus bombacis]|uniref:Uncharacterized protein n=1 Tax=Ceraceosorus bombacis TaxID=401625 RepID=A0A0P1BMS7_9BASI|nr:hypothetical protein CBOM_03239 [Ceraceosorus bombacis]